MTPPVADWTYPSNQIIPHHVRTMVLAAMRMIATMPICFLPQSGDFRYAIPGQYFIARNAIAGKIRLKAYIHTCVSTEVDNGFSLANFAPQFGQK
jgi:hypothetical protein